VEQHHGQAKDIAGFFYKPSTVTLSLINVERGIPEPHLDLDPSIDKQKN
jgi:hypothetical protein